MNLKTHLFTLKVELILNIKDKIIKNIYVTVIIWFDMYFRNKNNYFQTYILKLNINEKYFFVYLLVFVSFPSN